MKPPTYPSFEFGASSPPHLKKSIGLSNSTPPVASVRSKWSYHERLQPVDGQWPGRNKMNADEEPSSIGWNIELYATVDGRNPAPPGMVKTC